MNTYKLHLIRHGLTRANIEGKYLGLSDYPLCDEGVDALLDFMKGKLFPRGEKIYSSPLRRCRETAAVLYPGQDITAVLKLNELDFGLFEGKTLQELHEDEAFIAWSRDSMNNAPPEGEDGVSFIKRVVDGLDWVFQDMMEEAVFSGVLVVPGGVIMTALALMGFPRKPMGEWDSQGGGGYTILMTPELWGRDKIFEIMGPVPLDESEGEGELFTKQYYDDGEEMFFE